MNPAQQLKYLATFLDSHLLRHLLTKNANAQTTELQKQIKAKQLSADKTAAAAQETAAAAKANKLVTLL